ncbi:MAG: hypothetical protein JW990_13465 [Thermoleophilia bacterium]|nr:hypothetical protein [Thermoleophilia bacterium]
MPGIFGTTGVVGAFWEPLREEYLRIWGGIDTVEAAGGRLGGHAFGQSRAVLEAVDGTRFAVDGEASLYTAADDCATGRQPALFTTCDGEFRLTDRCCGNLAAVDVSGTWHIGVSHLSSFPMYYSRLNGGLVFSTLLRPLAKTLEHAGCRPDMTGTVQWLRRGNYMFGRRTFFDGISRLLPGQILRYRSDEDCLESYETSDLWTGGYDSRVSSAGQAIELCWEGLQDALRDHVDTHWTTGLMMSGGWDSRVLLAGLRETFGPKAIACLSHGDPKSREIAIVRRACETSGVSAHVADTAKAYDLSALDAGFDRVETVTGPEWLCSGRAFADMGLQTATAGTYGEILGGDQGPDDLKHGLNKIPSLARELLRYRGAAAVIEPPDTSLLRDAFAVTSLSRPWYFLRSAWEEIQPLEEEMNADLEWDLDRLVRRGIEDQNQLLEAFLVESRQVQFTSRQLLSCRVAINVSIPYADVRFVRLVARIPWSLKYHRSVMRGMLERHAQDLLRIPVAAALVPASAPVLVQEASRLLRRTDERTRWRLHNLTRGRVPYPRYSWWWYEFLNDGRFLFDLVDDLRCGFWDRAVIRQRLTDALAGKPRLATCSTAADLAAHLLRVSTVDRMLR